MGTIYSHQMNYYKKGLVSDVRHKHISKILIAVQIQGGFPPISSIISPNMVGPSSAPIILSVW